MKQEEMLKHPCVFGYIQGRKPRYESNARFCGVKYRSYVHRHAKMAAIPTLTLQHSLLAGTCLH
jgi:hypothetical protein